MEEILFWIVYCPLCNGADGGTTFAAENADFDGEHCPKCKKPDYDLSARAVTGSILAGLSMRTLAKLSRIAMVAKAEPNAEP